MTDKPTRRALMRPLQLLLVAFGSALFAGVITLMTTRDLFFIAEGHPTFPITFVVFGITFIGVLLILALLILAVDPAEFERRVDRAVLLPPEVDEAGTPGATGESKPTDPQVL